MRSKAIVLFSFGVGQLSERLHEDFGAYQMSVLNGSLPELPIRCKVYGSIFTTAYYFTDVLIGAPTAQTQSLIIDTGSSTQGIPCAQCEYCGTAHWEKPYDMSLSEYNERIACGECAMCRLRTKNQDFASMVPSDANIGTKEFSESFSKQLRQNPDIMQCFYDVHYAEGSQISGLFYEDVYWFNTGNETDRLAGDNDACASYPRSPGPDLPLRLTLGCHTKETHLFRDQKASGILGMEFWGTRGTQTFTSGILMNLHELYSNAKLKVREYCEDRRILAYPENMFGLCLGHDGGQLTFGGMSDELHISGAGNVKIPLIGASGGQLSYTIGLERIEVTTIGTRSPVLHSKKYLSEINANNGWTLLNIPRGSSTLATKTGAKAKIFPTLIDSGTTLSYFSSKIFRDILKSVELRVSSNTRMLARALSANRQGDGRIAPSTIFSNDAGPPIIRERFMSRRGLRDRNRIQFIPVSDEAVGSGPKRLVRLSNMPMEVVSRRLRGVMDGELRSGLSDVNRYSDGSNWYAVIDPQVTQLGNEQAEAEEVLLGFVDIPTAMEPAVHRSLVSKVDNNSSGECWWLQNGRKDLDLFPMLRFKFYGTDKYIAWHPQVYLYNGKNEHFWCLAMMTDALSGSDEGPHELIFGANSFIKKDLGFYVSDLSLTQNATAPINHHGGDFSVMDTIWVSVVEADCPNYETHKV